jgi:hypothetical protein
MATITRNLLGRITEDVAQTPLQEHEFRGIANMGGYFISLQANWNDMKPMFSITINERLLFIYYRPE